MALARRLHTRRFMIDDASSRPLYTYAVTSATGVANAAAARSPARSRWRGRGRRRRALRRRTPHAFTSFELRSRARNFSAIAAAVGRRRYFAAMAGTTTRAMRDLREIQRVSMRSFHDARAPTSLLLPRLSLDGECR